MFDALLKNETDTSNVCSVISEMLKPGDIVTLEGDLGVGKTSFCRYLIQSFSKEKTEVLSPTFSLVQTYEFSGVKLNHYDLFRIKNAEELYETGLEDFLEDSISLIEWPGIAESFLYGNRLKVKLEFADLSSRILKITGYNKFKNIEEKLVKRVELIR